MPKPTSWLGWLGWQSRPAAAAEQPPQGPAPVQAAQETPPQAPPHASAALAHSLPFGLPQMPHLPPLNPQQLQWQQDLQDMIFDSIKTRMQAYSYPSAIACIRQTYKDEGVAGFYRGVIPTLSSVIVLRGVSFSIYYWAKTGLLDMLPPQTPAAVTDLRVGLAASQTPQASDGSTWSEHSRLAVASFLSGALTGTIVTAISAPIDLVKIQKQLERVSVASSANEAAAIVTGSSSARVAAAARAAAEVADPVGGARIPSAGGSGPTGGRSSTEWFVHIVRTRGVLGLWTGFTTHVIRDSIGTGIYFSLYEMFKLVATPEGQTAGPLIHMLGGGIAGTLAWTFLFPIDVVKSVIQQDAFSAKRQFPGGAWEFIRRRYARHGVAGFFRGIGPQLVRSFPVHSLNFVVYEHVLKTCREL
ncbi:mitochondrial carrier domain-containing protein [Entophlyctis helioformis]|nr:mitochondrial carrier domain-containing protein [Entophlyctis helioformis]